MEDNQLAKKEGGLDYTLNYQCHSDDKNLYTTSTISSYSGDKIVGLTQEFEKIEESGGNGLNSQENISLILKEPSEHTRISDPKYSTKVLPYKSLENQNINHIGTVTETIDLYHEETKESNEEQCKHSDSKNSINKFLLNKVSPLQLSNHYFNTNTEWKESTNSEVDYIGQTYRNIIKQINEVSEGFKKGKKWKCNNPSHCHHHHNHQHYHRPHCRQYNAPRYFGSGHVVLEEGKDVLMLKNQNLKNRMEDDIDVTPMSDSVFEGESNEGRERILVRQMATEHAQDYNPEDIDYYDDDEDIAIVIESEAQRKSSRWVNQMFITTIDKHESLGNFRKSKIVILYK